MEPQSSKTNEDLMEEFEEELELLVDKANRLICKNGRFSLKASSTEGEKENRLMLMGKVIAEKILNKNKVVVITTKAWAPAKGMSVKVIGENLFLFYLRRK